MQSIGSKRLDEMDDVVPLQKLISKITTSKKDKCFLTENTVVFLIKQMDEDQFQCLLYRKQCSENYFTHFLPSKDIGKYFLRNSVQPVVCIKCRDNLLQKCCCMKVEDGFVISALVHELVY